MSKDIFLLLPSTQEYMQKCKLVLLYMYNIYIYIGQLTRPVCVCVLDGKEHGAPWGTNHSMLCIDTTLWVTQRAHILPYDSLTRKLDVKETHWNLNSHIIHSLIFFLFLFFLGGKRGGGGIVSHRIDINRRKKRNGRAERYPFFEIQLLLHSQPFPWAEKLATFLLGTVCLKFSKN